MYLFLFTGGAGVVLHSVGAIVAPLAQALSTVHVDPCFIHRNHPDSVSCNAAEAADENHMPRVSLRLYSRKQLSMPLPFPEPVALPCPRFPSLSE